MRFRPATSCNREAVPVGTRGNPDMPREHGTELFFTAEAAPSCDGLDSVVGFLERPPCRVDADAFNRARWRLVAGLGVAAREIAGTHADAFREALDTQIGGQMLGYPAFQLSERVIRGLYLRG